MISIALPKGRLGNKAHSLLKKCGYAVADAFDESRKLIFENEASGVRYFLVKPSDVAIYVEYGAADIGVAGKDILLESGADVFELLDLGIGKCDMCVAAKNDFREDKSRPLVVATKFSSITKNYYLKKNREIEIIKLYGSIELAPILGMSDVIVDIVETGTTLKENNLRVYEKFLPISARLIANKAAFKFKESEINGIVKKLKEAANDKDI
jgi:ATP phosphoribosyltransferase